MTLHQAAAEFGITAREIVRMAADGRLLLVPDGHGGHLVHEDGVADAEHADRTRSAPASAALDGQALADYLTAAGYPTDRAMVSYWARRGLIVRVNRGRQGTRALYDPAVAMAVAQRHRRANGEPVIRPGLEREQAALARFRAAQSACRRTVPARDAAVRRLRAEQWSIARIAAEAGLTPRAVRLIIARRQHS